MRGLHRPHAPLEPVEQREVVGRAAEERLAEVDVRLHEAGQHGAAARVDDEVGLEVGEVAADGLDARPAHEHVAAQDAPGGVHRHDGAAPYEDSLLHLK